MITEVGRAINICKLVLILLLVLVHGLFFFIYLLLRDRSLHRRIGNIDHPTDLAEVVCSLTLDTVLSILKIL